MPLSDPIRVVKKVSDALNELGIQYLIGGSLASSLYGVPRATQDVDIVADLSLQHMEKLNEVLSLNFYVDIEMAREAIKRRSSFNIIDKDDLYKVDIFIQGLDDLSIAEMDRRILYELTESEKLAVYLCSPEDIIAHKLYWFKLGNGVSERQWNDALNVAKVQRNRLDLEYLRMICRKRGVSDLFEKLMVEEK